MIQVDNHGKTGYCLHGDSDPLDVQVGYGQLERRGGIAFHQDRMVVLHHFGQVALGPQFELVHQLFDFPDFLH